ncbi:hypothetical protein F4801DRAFT_605270 [Xylaria longipes]|nr:hypothetical protein F4801DRAFT_605270 [Xylaria longipes]
MALTRLLCSIVSLFHRLVKGFIDLFKLLVKIIKAKILPGLTKWTSLTEEPKVALHKHRGRAILATLPHIIPATVALFLITINIKTYVIGDIAQSAVSALQFAAMILLSLVRGEMTGSGRIALGAWLATIDVSCLCSVWILGFFTSREVWSWRRVFLTALIPSFVVLEALIGPTSAVRLDLFPTAKCFVFADNSAVLFPGKMDLNYTNIYTILLSPPARCSLTNSI